MHAAGNRVPQFRRERAPASAGRTPRTEGSSEECNEASAKAEDTKQHPQCAGRHALPVQVRTRRYEGMARRLWKQGRRAMKPRRGTFRGTSLRHEGAMAARRAGGVKKDACFAAKKDGCAAEKKDACIAANKDGCAADK